MSTTELRQFLTTTSVRGRVAFVLAIAGRALSLLVPGTPAYTVSTKVVNAAWPFAEGGHVAALHLNQYLEIIVEMEMGAVGAEKQGLSVIGLGVAYITWEAFGIDLATGAVRDEDVPGEEMADISEKDIETVYLRVVDALGDEMAKFCHNVINAIGGRSNPGNAADPLGVGIPRALVEGA
jgi:hypothetical protein